MTSFNAVGAILPLDEYWKNCVHPKPLIPPSYPGARFHTHSNQAGPTQEGQTRQAEQRQVGHRQPGNVRSYKDEDGDSDDDEERVGTSASLENSLNCSADSDFKSNVSQMNYEMDDFNKTYCDESTSWQSESSNSVQGRRPNANTARPNVGQKSNVKSRLNFKNRWNKRNGNQKPRKNNGNTIHHLGANQNQQQQQARFMMQEHMRYAYNSFRDNTVDQPPNVLMNHTNNLQTIPQNPPDMFYSSTVTSMIDSVANLAVSRVPNQSYVSFETPGPSLNAGNGAQAQLNTQPNPGHQVELNNYTVQQVARHVSLMMTTVSNIDTQETPEYFKSKKSGNAAGGQSHIYDQPEGFN
ncbi:uncharacterized protein Boot [Drosophila kikkawai]|uniref:Uncharacterized protein Boot n=1 Tax=Drosophila kikkawai TaxID=30033 RepID=A0A6P4IV18_DROKI|nr:uncharacterized protein LOC108078128 [Drosophila kikkawai]